MRYQPHGVDHLRLSHAIEYEVGLMPERRLWIETRPGVGARKVVVEGPGFEAPQLEQPAHQPSVMRFETLSWDDAAREWRSSLLIGSGLRPSSDPTSNRYRWEHDFDLPLEGSNHQRFILVAEEYERLPLDRPTGTFDDGKAEFEEVQGERLTFSCLQHVAYPR